MIVPANGSCLKLEMSERQIQGSIKEPLNIGWLITGFPSWWYQNPCKQRVVPKKMTETLTKKKKQLQILAPLY